MNHFGQPITVVHGMTRNRFEADILPAAQPVLMKEAVIDWPAVQLARQSDMAICDYIKACDNGRPAPTLLGDPSIKGAFFYGETTRTFNFQRGEVPISVALDRLFQQKSQPKPYAVYVQSSPVTEHLPQFRVDNIINLLSQDVEPRIWIGNALEVQTHNDSWENIACLVAGKRRFTLFPPDQLSNLYIGPFESTPAGAPVSMARLSKPDFEQHPRFKEALDHAVYADLEPGDALYIPYFWWHHVRSVEPFNVLVNYWWNGDDPTRGSPQINLLHSILTIRDMPPAHRAAWKVMFDHYVFEMNGDAPGHLKGDEKGVLGALTPAMEVELKAQVLADLQRRWGE